jgi:hypothetical protein
MKIKRPKSEYDFCECVANDRHSITYPRRASSYDESMVNPPDGNPHSASLAGMSPCSGATMAREAANLLTGREP